MAVTIDAGAPSTGSTAVTLAFSPPSNCVSIYARNEDGSGGYLPSLASPQTWTLAPGDGVKTVTLTYTYTFQYVCGQYQCGSYCCNYDTWGNCTSYCPTYCDQYCTGQTSCQDSASILLSTHSSSSTVAFAAPTLNSAGSGTKALIHGDFNRDGKIDVAVANAGSNAVAILLGNGDGTFQAASNYSVAGGSPVSIATADFNGDGIADLVTANNGSNNASVILGNGDGTFQGALTYSVGNMPTAVVVGDFNRDGKMDLAFANYGMYSVSILIGNGNGNFFAPDTYPVAGAAMSLAADDFNGDGALDLAVANYGSNNVSVLLGNGSGSFQAAVNYATGSYPFSVATADYNNDGKADLFVANYGGNTLSILKGNGNGTFSAVPSYSTGTSPRSVVPCDFNRDGLIDLAITYSGGGVTVLRGYENGTFFRADFTAGSDPWGVDAADFDGDGRTDLAAASNGSGAASILLNSGVIEASGAFDAGPDNTVGDDAAWLVTGDFNRDGNLDIATANNSSHSVSVLLGNGNGTFQSALAKDTGDSASCLAVGDFNRDGRLDLAVSRPLSASVMILFGNGDGAFSYGPVFGTSYPEPRHIAIGDFDRDGWPDLVVSHSVTFGQLSFYRNSGGSFSQIYQQSAGYSPGPLNVGDYDRNGTLDVAMLNYGSNNVGVWVNCGLSGCGWWVSRDVGPGPVSLAPGDFNRDGKVDLAVVCGDGTAVSALLGTGVGGFYPAANYSVGSGPLAVVSQDFNRDGKSDLAVAGMGGCSLETLWGNSDGTFQEAIHYDYGTIKALAFGDFNKDGKMDMAGIAGTNVVRIFPNVNAFKTLAVTKTGSGGGTITSAPTGISCGSGCSMSFNRSSVVTLTATPDSGSVFQGWSGDCAACGTDPNCTVTMSADRACTASFVPDPVAYWPFDDDTARDWIGSHDGTVTGPGVSFVPGKVGHAIKFDSGTSYVRVPGFNLARLTVSAWVYPAKYGYYTSMVTKNYYASGWSSPYVAWQLWLSENTASPGFIGGTLGNTVSTEAIPINQWSFLAATYDGTTVKLYVNGVLKASQAAPTPGDLPATTGDIYIGMPQYSNHSFLGMLDEVALFDRALSAGEISQQYQNGLSGQGYPVKTFSVAASAAGTGSGTVSCAAGSMSFDYPVSASGTTAPIREGTRTTITAAAGAGATASWNGTCALAGGIEAGNGTAAATCSFSSLHADKAASVTFTGKAGEASKEGAPMTLVKASGTAIQFNYAAASCATDHAVYWGQSQGAISSLVFSGGQCGLGTSGQAQADPGDPPAGTFFYFVIVGNNGTVEGSYGTDSLGTQRPESVGLSGCDIPQDINGACQ